MSQSRKALALKDAARMFTAAANGLAQVFGDQQPIGVKTPKLVVV